MGDGRELASLATCLPDGPSRRRAPVEDGAKSRFTPLQRRRAVAETLGLPGQEESSNEGSPVAANEGKRGGPVGFRGRLASLSTCPPDGPSS